MVLRHEMARRASSGPCSCSPTLENGDSWTKRRRAGRRTHTPVYNIALTSQPCCCLQHKWMQHEGTQVVTKDVVVAPNKLTYQLTVCPKLVTSFLLRFSTIAGRGVHRTLRCRVFDPNPHPKRPTNGRLFWLLEAIVGRPQSSQGIKTTGCYRDQKSLG